MMFLLNSSSHTSLSSRAPITWRSKLLRTVPDKLKKQTN